MPVPARMSFVTLGADDVDALRGFYERLGWTAARASVPGEVAFFWLNGAVLALYDRASLLREVGAEGAPAPAVRDSNIAINVERADQVAEVLAVAERAGGRILAAARTMNWGGTSGYFADPEGHAWEVAHNPFMPFDADGRIAELER
ncbi:MAG: VOC family protein [Dehalococcoidia bacterium]